VAAAAVLLLGGGIWGILTLLPALAVEANPIISTQAVSVEPTAVPAPTIEIPIEADNQAAPETDSASVSEAKGTPETTPAIPAGRPPAAREKPALTQTIPVKTADEQKPAVAENQKPAVTENKKKKVTVDDLINDTPKKKVTVDDLINDN
jgi:hypothetical protein